MNKIILSFKEIASRLTGFSIPIFGISWQPDESDIKIAKRIINFLEDRRVLYSYYELEVPKHCIVSINEIRRMLTDEISKLSQNNMLYNDLQLLRGACRKFLDSIQKYESDLELYKQKSSLSNWVFLSSLRELRGAFGIYLAKIASSYGVNIRGDLINILPISENSLSSNLE